MRARRVFRPAFVVAYAVCVVVATGAAVFPWVREPILCRAEAAEAERNLVELWSNTHAYVVAHGYTPGGPSVSGFHEHDGDTFFTYDNAWDGSMIYAYPARDPYHGFTRDLWVADAAGVRHVVDGCLRY